MSQGYAVTNALTGLADTAFTWGSAYAINRGRLNDGILDELASSAASAQASGQYLLIDFGSAVSLTAIAILNHNLASGACTVEVKCGTDATTGVTAKAASTVVTTAPNQKDTVLQFPAQSYRYWRLTFFHTGTKIVTLGELLAIATVTTLSRASAYGDGETEKAVLNRNVSQTGHQRSTFLAGPLRTKRRIYKDLSTSEKAELRAMWAASMYGNANLLWLDLIESSASAATEAAQECLWGKIEPEFDWTQGDYRLFDPGDITLVGQGREAGS